MAEIQKRISRTYDELIRLTTFEDRFNYLKTGSSVGESTFGYSRLFNQLIYHSARWKELRRRIIIRDDGKDLGIEERPITGIVVIHHMIPIFLEDIENDSPIIYEDQFLISCSDRTHKAIHFGDISQTELPKLITRTKNDTSPWKL